VQRGALIFIASVSGQGMSSGLRADDKILAVNGAPMLGLGLEQVVEHLRNPARPLHLFVSRVSPKGSSGQGGVISV
jgi:C-terminal processing protease CtpA/Prc